MWDLRGSLGEGGGSQCTKLPPPSWTQKGRWSSQLLQALGLLPACGSSGVAMGQNERLGEPYLAPRPYLAYPFSRS